MIGLILPFPALVILAAIGDVRSMTIPNWISLALAGLFVPVALILGLPPLQVGTHLAVGVIALLIGMALFALRWLGGGDAKLMAAVMVWLGASAALPFVVWTAIAGGIFSLFLLITRSHVPILAGVGPEFSRRLFQPKGDIPYGVAICIGALVAFADSAIFTAAAAT